MDHFCSQTKIQLLVRRHPSATAQEQFKRENNDECVPKNLQGDFKVGRSYTLTWNLARICILFVKNYNSNFK